MPIPVEIPIRKEFSEERIKEIEKYLGERLESRVRGLRGVREDKITTWRKVYDGTPREKSKSFPWQNASNVVIKLVRSFTDQLVAKIVMGTIAMDPVFVAELVGEFEREMRAEEQRDAIQSWLALCSLESERLNLIPKYAIWIRNVVKYGFGCMKLMPEMRIEQVAIDAGSRGVVFDSYTRHNGPVAMPLMFEDFLMAATTVELIRDPALFQRAKLERFQLENLKFDKSYDRAKINQALKNPTRTGPRPTERSIEDSTGARTDSDAINDNWDVYEAHFPYHVSGKTFRIISTLTADDMGTNPIFFKHVFAWLPDNALPYVGAWLAPDGERSYSPGFCELLADYQEEVSAIHNRRGDASTAANTNIFRIDAGQQTDSQFSVYPMATFTGAKDSFEVVPLGRTANETIKDEQMVLGEAQDLVGIGPSSTGQGAGTVNKKGAYSAMGTFAVMQEGNTRPNLNVTEFRVSHYTVGRLALMCYAHFGVDPQDIKALGRQAQYLQKALQNVKEGRIALPIRAATGSVNKEIEKQNLMLMLNNTRAHWQMVNQLLQASQNPMAPPQMQDYILQVILSSNLLMKRIVKDFGIEDPSSVVPDVLGLQEKADALKKQFDQAKQQMEAMQRQQQPHLGAGQPPPAGQNANVQEPQPQAPGAPGMGTAEPTITQ
jgi:hypothetical protein